MCDRERERERERERDENGNKRKQERLVAWSKHLAWENSVGNYPSSPFHSPPPSLVHKSITSYNIGQTKQIYRKKE